MKYSYEGIGAWSATFDAASPVEGQVVKLDASGAAAPCSSGDVFCGVCSAVRNGVCGVQLDGLCTVSYSGTTAPTVGYCTLTADGSGGVSVVTTGGRSYLVAAVDSTAATCVIKL